MASANDDGLGNTQDAKVLGDNNGTVSGKLRALSTVLNDVWDSTNHQLKTSASLVGGGGDGAILDGVTSTIAASVLDYTNSNPLAVRLTDTNGDYIAAAGGTQYTTASGPATSGGDVVTLMGAVRLDSPASFVAADFDRTLLLTDANGRLHVITPLPSGAATETTLASVLTQSDFDTKAGSLTEAAPATDTASSGLNGRLQRIAQRITSLIALVPAALTGSGNFKVAVQEAMPAGTNNIGDVDVLTVPADPFGANADAAVAAGATGSIQAKLRRATQGLEDLKSLIVLAAGTNAIGKLAANAGVDIGSVGTIAKTSGGYTPYRLVSAASDNATSLKGSAGQIGYIVVGNVNAAMRYLHIYNKASAPTLGTDTPVLTIPIPGNTAGAGAILPTPVGVEFTTGIAFAITTTTGTIPATGSVAANDITVSIGYK